MSLRRLLLPIALLTLLTPITAHAKPDALPPPIVPDCLGVNIHFTGAPTRDLDGLQSGGFRWIRMDFSWAGIEKTKGVYDFSAYDELLDGLTARHIRPLFILDYGNDLYQKGSPRTPEARAAFVRFAVAAVNHYRGKTILWEIWNEPNIGFWQPSPNVEEYGRLAVETARAIKEADPDATVLAPGSSTIPLPFLEALFKMGLLRYIDAVSLHPYRGSPPETAAADYRDVRRLIARYAPAGKDIPLVSSEWGYSSVNVTEQTQAQYLARQWLSNLAEGVRLSIWYDWHEDGQDPKDPEHHFGTVRWDYTPKPAYLAAKTLTGALAGYRFIKRIPLASDADYLLLFARGRDAVRLAAWTTGADHAIKLPLAGPCRITGLLGDRSTAPAGAPGQAIVSLRLTGSPQYLEPPAAGNTALLRAAAWNVRPSPAFYGADQPINLALSYTNTDSVPHRARFLIVLSTPASARKIPVIDGEDNVAPGATLQQGTRSSKLARVPVRARVALVLDGARQLYPQDVAFSPLDPIALTVAPAATRGFQVQVSDPTGTGFTGRLEAAAAGQTRRLPVRLAAGQTSAEVAVPGDPQEATAFTLRDRQGRPIANAPARRFVPYPLTPDALRTTLEGDPKVTSTVHADDSSGSDGDARLTVRYAFAPGWTYWRTGQASPAALPGHPLAFGIWVSGDGSDNIVRMRFTDSTGQTFQPDGGPLDWTGWRYVTFPLTLSGGQNVGHWGGAGDGKIHYPIRIESLFLLDSPGAARKSSGTISLRQPSIVYGPGA